MIDLISVPNPWIKFASITTAALIGMLGAMYFIAGHVAAPTQAPQPIIIQVPAPK
jgi:hypothetical protein